eukprot:snap_masked-scaffold_2-processed-gene-3.32-mRNA-1 protein AED:0.16 eAED:0.27 QI:0/-1/0/1/-1/1/1/0/190
MGEDDRSVSRSRSRSGRSASRSRSRSGSRGRSRSRDSRRSRSRSGSRGGSANKNERKTGEVARWHPRGFGFIRVEDGEDVFVHVSSIKDGNALREGSKVEFGLIYDDKRSKYRAVDLTGGFREERHFGGGGGYGRDRRDDYRDRGRRDDYRRDDYRDRGRRDDYRGGGGRGYDRRSRSRERYRSRSRGRY